MGRAKKNVEVEAQVIARGNVVPMMTEAESAETVQYVSDEDAAREDRLVSEIRMITEQTKQVVLFNSIEIGRRLTEAKAMVKRGTWGTWLKERVDYSQRTANNFMKIYQEYGRNGLAEKSQALANLSYTQALALIDLPEDERARFAEERKAGEMALRKLQEEVRQENESWAQMSDGELFDTLIDLDGRYCVTEDQETIGERLNALFKSGELFEKIYPVVVSENNKENFTEAGITFDRYLDMLITYRVELMQMNDGIGTIRLQDSHLETFGISRQKIREAAFANLEGIVDFMTLRDDASGFKMVAATRKDKQFGGAAAMLLPSVRRRLAEMFGTDSLVFLPSSITEVIVVAQTAGEPETLLAMVHEINEMEVALEERLTDSIYPMRLADGEYRLSVIRP